MFSFPIVDTAGPVGIAALLLLDAVSLGAVMLYRRGPGRVSHEPGPAAGRRRYERANLVIDGDIGGLSCHVVDLSLSGASVLMRPGPAPEPGDRFILGLNIGGTALSLRSRVVRAEEFGLRTRLGVSFTGSREEMRALSLLLSGPPTVKPNSPRVARNVR